MTFSLASHVAIQEFFFKKFQPLCEASLFDEISDRQPEGPVPNRVKD